MTLKIFRNAFLVGIVAVVLCSVLFLGVLYEYDENQVYTQLTAAADYIALGVERSGSEYLYEQSSPNRITWIDTDGTVLFDSVADAQNMDNHLDREEIAEALESGSGQSSHYSKTLLEKTLYSAKRLSDGTVIRVSVTKSTVATLLLGMLQPFVWIVLLVLVLSGILASRLAKQITKPINCLDPDHPENCRTYPELTPLVDRLLEQNRTIRQQMDELSHRQQKFAAITENMSEGFLLVDSRRNILSSNRSALLLAFPNLDSPERIEQAGCRAEVYASIEAALAGAHSEHLLAADERSYRVIANPVVASGQVTGAVVVIMDVTEREQRETLRREFSANVSHELKTPLTSISGFAELMKDGMVVPEKIREFAGDIYSESLRLIALIDDIIRLSEMDEDSAGFEEEDVDLYGLAGDVIESLRPAAARQNVSIVLEGENAAVHGVWQILYEMIFNLCDNAIKYNVQNGSVTVCVSKNDEEESVILRVSDTGIGIPYAHQSRVFERFYRVDKSHSKQIGGTGLGLSIVKHGAQYHNARIALESAPGKGTTITVTFPASYKRKADALPA